MILQSFPEPRQTTNPYIVMLRDSLDRTPGITVRTFSFRTGLLGRYDIFHAHWPEILVSGSSGPKALVRQLLFALLLLRLTVRRTPLVRTMHNVALPTDISRRERALLRIAERQTRLRIVLNEHTPVQPGAATALIPHGHYRDWFAGLELPDAVEGRIAFVGLIRRYKGVDRLLRTFASVADPGLELHVSGRPSTDSLATELTERAASDPRVRLRLEYLSDADMVAEISSAQLVVLPYAEMHNSGGALAVLSVGRPVLVPDNAVNRALSTEAGDGWVITYDGQLEADDLERARSIARRRLGRGGKPNLDERSWDQAGEAHVAAYTAATAAARSRPRWRRRAGTASAAGDTRDIDSPTRR